MIYDFSEKEEMPLNVRGEIAILLGAGFSVPKGYPTGDNLNQKILYFDKNPVVFLPSGKLAISTTDNMASIHQKYFIFCKRLIKEYARINAGFDYECFYDFITSHESKSYIYRESCKDLVSSDDEYYDYLFNAPHIYNQMVLYLLKDKDGKSHYDNEPFHIDCVEGYDGFLKYIAQLSKRYIVNIHTLNHDLLFESFNHTRYINGRISDGFDEYGSVYFGNLQYENMAYHCRLERYTGRYNTPIRLYKLHGSINYVPFYKKMDNGNMKPERYVKLKYGIAASDIMKGRKSKCGYDISPFEYHPDFLTGTTSKIHRYNEPLLFKKLFKKFKNNLLHAEKLIIIGYGCKDQGINDMIIEYFDHQHKPSFIVDKSASEDVMAFAQKINAKVYKESVCCISEKLFV